MPLSVLRGCEFFREALSIDEAGLREPAGMGFGTSHTSEPKEHRLQKTMCSHSRTRLVKVSERGTGGTTRCQFRSNDERKLICFVLFPRRGVKTFRGTAERSEGSPTGAVYKRCKLMNAVRLPLVLALSVTPWLAVPGAGASLPAKELVRAIRENGLDPSACYRVRDLSFAKEDVRVYLNDGYLIFTKPVEGRRTAALFSADVEGGDGEVIVLPPTRSERESLARFATQPNLDEHIRSGFFVFADGTAEDLIDQIGRESAGKKAPEMGAVLASQWSPVAANIEGPMALRLVQDALAPARPGRGLTFLAMSGKTLGNFDIIVEPRGGARVEIRRRTERDNKAAYDVWTSFPARSARRTPTVSPKADFAVTAYRIDANLDNELRLKAVTKAVLRVGSEACRTLALLIAQNMQITGVRLDGAPVEILRGDAEQRSRLAIEDDESAVLIVPAEPLAAGTEHTIEFEHEGNVVKVAGNGVFFVADRASWYPHIGFGGATFDVSFRYPKRLTLVNAGELVSDKTEGEWRTTRRRIAIPVSSAGFNLGDYEKVSVRASGVSIDVYGNRHLEDSLRPPVEILQPLPGMRGRGRGGSQVPGGFSMPAVQPVPDPLARLKAVAADVAAAVDFYSGLYGPPALKTLTVAPIPGTFGQGFPGLLYLSTFAYLDPSERPSALRGAKQQVFFSDMLAAHETAHQWWGAVTSVDRSEDAWIIEGLANYSAIMWMEKKKGFKAVLPVLQGYRDELLADTGGKSVPESAGPIVWGDRLMASQIPDAWRAVTYGKGVWVLHMLRRRMGDERFLAMLAELRKRYEFRTVTTERLRALIQEFRPKGLTAEAIDTFFDNWVYATGVPSLKVNYKATGVAPAVTLAGTLEQSGVDEDFSVDVPVEIQYAKGPSQTVWVRTSTGQETFSEKLRQMPVRVVLPDDILHH